MKKFLYLGFCGLLAAGMTGCKDDVISDVSSSLQDIGGETGYLTFQIKSADTGGMTRAWLDENYNFNEGEGAAGKFADENKIVNNVQANRVFFFDENGDWHSSALLNLTKQEENNHSSSHNDNYPETFYSATVKRTSDRGEENWPTQCLVVLNGRPGRLNALLARAQASVNTGEAFGMAEFLGWVNTDLTETDAAGEGETLGLYKYDEGDGDGEIYYFTMTNSVFVDDVKDATGGTTKGIVSSAQITEENLKHTSEEAAEHPVTVYVERIMSKVEVGFKDFDNYTGSDAAYIEEDDDAHPYGYIYSFSDDHETNSSWFDVPKTIEMKALITNWTVNAVEYQAQLFKQLDSNWITNEPFTSWNDPTHHRSYWGKDANYEWNNGDGVNGKGYPSQYRSVFPTSDSARPYQDKTTGRWSYGASTVEEKGNDIYNPSYPWALDYKPFNKILNKRKYKYCLENTFGYPAQNDGSYKNMIMGSHVLIQGRLITAEEEKSLTPDGKADLDAVIGDKYYYGDRYYDETTYINRQVAIIRALLGEHIGTLEVKNRGMWPTDADGTGNFNVETTEGNLYVKDTNGDFLKITVNNEAKTGEIKATDVFCIAPAYITKGDDKVTIALKNEYKEGWDGKSYGYNTANVNLYYYKADQLDDETGEIKDGQTPTQLTRNQAVSIIYQLGNEAGCFKAGRMYYAVPVQHYLAAGAGNDYKFEYAGLKAGDYGMVRNHWYKFLINTIMKPGVPVHDEDQPIIPNYEDTDRYIGLEVIILPWRIVDNGNVTLGTN